jgi:catechol-2,3-dioxygenase
MSATASNNIPDFDAASTHAQVLRPVSLAHVVLRTANLARSAAFYTAFLGGHVAYSNPTISFITYDEEHHRIALVELPGTRPKDAAACGLEHIAFGFGSLADLLLAYRQRRARGIEPVWCVNHGPTTSIYYRDPDGNMLETQVDNFATVEEAAAFMESTRFAENPIGTDFDPEELIKALRAGVDEEVLKKRREIGPRGIPDLTQH